MSGCSFVTEIARVRSATGDMVSSLAARSRTICNDATSIAWSCKGGGLRHLQQHIRQPLRLIDHHVVAGIVVDEGLPGRVGLALRQRLVESRLRIFRRANVGLLGDGLALA